MLSLWYCYSYLWPKNKVIICYSSNQLRVLFPKHSSKKILILREFLDFEVTQVVHQILKPFS